MNTISKCVLSVLLLALIAANCANHLRQQDQTAGSTAQSDPSKNETENYAIYSVLIRRFFTYDNVDSVVILAKTVLRTMEQNDLKGTLDYVRGEIQGGISDELVQGFQQANAKPTILEDHFNGHIKRVLITEEQARDLTKDGWAKFLSQYPGRGIITFSAVGFDKDRRRALVNASTQSGGKSGWSKYFFLEKENNEWVIKDQVQVWAS